MKDESVVQSAADCIQFEPKVVNKEALLMLAIGRLVVNKMGVAHRQKLFGIMSVMIETQVHRDKSPLYVPHRELDPSERGRNQQMAGFIAGLTGSEAFVRRHLK